MNKIYCVMEYECPKSWESLIETSRADIRYCNHCNKKVYLCASQEEIEAAASLKKCVAYDTHKNYENRKNTGIPTTRDNAVRRTVGLPKDYMNSETKEKFNKFINSK